MEKLDLNNLIDKQKYIFGSIFLLANKLQVLGDQHISERGYTIRQWLLTIAIAQFDNEPPTLSEVAKLLSNSHQNVKQLALKLEKKGFLSIEKDSQDKRIIRLRLTKECLDYWSEREEKDNEFIRDLFKELSEEEIDVICNVFHKLTNRLLKMSEQKTKG